MEKWQDIFGYEGKYQVSNYGRIKTLPRPIYRKGTNRLHFNRKEKIIGNNIGSHGYYSLFLFLDCGVKIGHTVHSIVAKHFIPNPENKPCVNHIDGNKLNNHVSNLEWVTYSENLIHAHKTGLQRCYSLQATNVKTSEVISFESVSDAEKAGFHQQSISDCCRGKLQTYRGYKWTYGGESCRAVTDKLKNQTETK